METSVFRTILDRSISGDKIYGGTIDQLNALYVDALYVPSSGSGGAGNIDGTDFTIGYNQQIGYCQADVFMSNGAGYLLRNGSGTLIAQLINSTENPNFSLFNSSSLMLCEINLSSALFNIPIYAQDAFYVLGPSTLNGTATFNDVVIFNSTITAASYFNFKYFGDGLSKSISTFYGDYLATKATVASIPLGLSANNIISLKYVNTTGTTEIVKEKWDWLWGVGIAGGGLQVTTGNISTESGDISTTLGDIYTTAGNIYTTAGDIYTATGNITIDAGTARLGPSDPAGSSEYVTIKAYPFNMITLTGKVQGFVGNTGILHEIHSGMIKIISVSCMVYSPDASKFVTPNFGGSSNYTFAYDDTKIWIGNSNANLYNQHFIVTIFYAPGEITYPS